MLILSPFVAAEDVDPEMMHYRPNCWPLIPMFIETVMRNGRVPDDYDMSHLFSAVQAARLITIIQLAHRNSWRIINVRHVLRLATDAVKRDRICHCL